jgi:N-sulfoglucosamine sulfohydrolase
MSRPNILFCIADDAGMHFGAYGCPWVDTPAFDRVAREGLLFQNAFTPNAKCAPSRACILTGRNSWQLEEACNHTPYFPAKFKTFAETLGEHGYHVGYTNKGWAPGNPGMLDGKPRELCGTPYNQHTCESPTNCTSSNDYTANFKSFLKDRDKDQPFCFWYGAQEPHRPYEYESGCERGGKKLEDIDEVYPIWPDNEVVRKDLLDYGYEIEYFDKHLGKMLDELEKAGELENTLVVVTSDNGMPFPAIKGQEYYYSNHLPLAMMWPKGIQSPGRSIEDFVNFIDFAPTFLEISDIDAEEAGMEPITGRSLTEFFNTDVEGIVNPTRDHHLLGKERHDVGRPLDQGYPIRGILKDGFLYLRNFEPDRWPAGNPETGYLNCDGSPTKTEILKCRKNPDTKYYWDWAFGKRPAEQLYDYVKDPACINNLANEVDHQERKEALRKQLYQELTDQGDPRILGDGDLFDSYPYADPVVANFYERYLSGERPPTFWVNDSDFEDGPLD